jgi:nucleoside-diphosphate-sugar epimerase
MAARVNLVLGGAGLVGSALCDELKGRDEAALSLDLRTGFDLRADDLGPYSGVDRVWFLAWDVGGWKYLSARQNQAAMFANNTAICLRVFQFLGSTHLPFLFVSSQMVGAPGAYGTTKALGEAWTKALGGTIVRLWNVYGWEAPGPKSHVVPDLVTTGLRGEVVCGSNGMERRQFLDRRDCARALCAAFDAGPGSYDVSSGEWTRIREVAGEIARQLAAPLRFGNEAGYEQIIEPQRPVPGWAPLISLQAGLAAVIEDARRAIRTGSPRASGVSSADVAPRP